MNIVKSLFPSVVRSVLMGLVAISANGTPAQQPQSPGIVGDVTFTGEEKAGSTVEVTCRFMIPIDAYGVKEVKERMGGDYLSAGIDSVLFYSNPNIEILTTPVWKGKLVPDVEFSFGVTVLLKDGFEGNLYVAAFTRYGIQSIGHVPFFFGERPRPLGYVVDTIIDSAGNRTHRHRRVLDSLTPGFIFDTSGLPLPDTTFDRLGRIKFIIKSVLDVKSLPFQLPGPTPKVRLVGTTKRKVPTKPSGSSNQQSSILVPERNATT